MLAWIGNRGGGGHGLHCAGSARWHVVPSRRLARGHLSGRGPLRNCGRAVWIDLRVKALELAVSLADYLRHAFGVTTSDPGLAAVDPQAIRARTFDALRRLLVAEAGRRPLVVLVEDLYWIDQTPEDFLAGFTTELPSVPIMLLATYRSGYSPPWIGKSFTLSTRAAPAVTGGQRTDRGLDTRRREPGCGGGGRRARRRQPVLPRRTGPGHQRPRHRPGRRHRPRDGPAGAGRCYRHRYLAILRQRSVSTDRQRSMSITVTRTNPGRCLVCGVSTMSAAAPLTLRN
jgi:hypothetical protein